MNKIILSIVSTAIIFGLGIYTLPNINLVIFVLIAYVLPVVANLIIHSTLKNKSLSFTASAAIMAGITTAGYYIFGRLLMNSPYFEDFIASGTSQLGELQVSIASNLVSIGQLVFVFLLNFGLLYLVQIMTKNNNKGDVRHA